MEVKLSAKFILTDQRPESSYGRPVLVDLESGQAYGPGDMIKTHNGLRTGTAVVTLLINDKKFNDEQMEFIKRF